MVFSQPFLIRPRVRLPEKENRRICQISGLKSGRARSLKKSEKWSPTRGGRCERVHCMEEELVSKKGNEFHGLLVRGKGSD